MNILIFFSGLSFSRKNDTNVKIHIHEKDQFLDFSGRMGHEVKTGEKVSAQINIHEVHQLERKFDDPHKTHGQASIENTTKHGTVCKDMAYDPCILNELSKSMIDETDDRCLVPWFPKEYSLNYIGNHTVCTKENDINSSFNIYYKRITNQQNDCNKPCKSIVLNIGGKNYEKNENQTFGVGLFYFSMTSTKTTEKYLYSFTSMFAEIGGYLGLLLGYSFLDLASTIHDVCLKHPWSKIGASR